MSAKVHIGSIVIRVDDLPRQIDFWTEALDYVAREDHADDFAVLRPRDGEGPNVSLDVMRSEVTSRRASTWTSTPMTRPAKSSG